MTETKEYSLAELRRILRGQYNVPIENLVGLNRDKLEDMIDDLNEQRLTAPKSRVPSSRSPQSSLRSRSPSRASPFRSPLSASSASRSPLSASSSSRSPLSASSSSRSRSPSRPQLSSRPTTRSAAAASSVPSSRRIEDVEESNKRLYLLVGAIVYDDLPKVKHLVNSGADINDVLLIAAKYGQPEMVGYAVENGADVHINDDAALVEAAGKGHYRTVRGLLVNGANPNAMEGEAIYFAARNNELDILKLLDEAGADLPRYGVLGLRAAASLGNLGIVNYLLSRGVNVNNINDEDLEVARNNGNDLLVAYIQSLRQ